MKPPIIAFTGLAQSGKTLAASMFSDSVNISFADPIKEMIRVLTGETDKNATPKALCGRTLRYAYQTLGTEWGRQMIGEVWLRYSERRIVDLLDDNFVSPVIAKLITIDDLRFGDEAAMVHSFGGIVVHIRRPGIDRMSHASEQGIDPSLVDHWITAETPEELSSALYNAGLLELNTQVVYQDE